MIRWINEYLGTAPFGDSDIAKDHSVLDVRDLVDKHGNSLKITKEKIERGVELLREGCRLIVCCDYGISRSNAIAAGILSRYKITPLEEAVRQVVRATGEKEIKLGPLRAVREALADTQTASQASGVRLLITGGNGFIGRQLQSQLADNTFWISPSRSEVDLTAGALELDLLIKEHQINTLVHLANPRVYTSNKAMGDTVTLLRNVLEVCRDNSLRLIYPSGWEVYSGYRANNMIVNESVPLLPKGPYGETKALCEQLVEWHRTQHGLQCVQLRSAPLYGENSDRPKFIYNFLTKALRGDPIQTHRYINGEPCLDLMCVDDFVTALIAAIASNFSGTLNIGSGQSVSTLQVAQWIVNECGSTSRIECREIEDFAPNITMDCSRAKQEIGWFSDIDWKKGLGVIISKYSPQKKFYAPSNRNFDVTKQK
jgi:nucleoside-diphosphate-sugar epimerase